MPIVAEKLSSRSASRSAIASQFWEQAEHSSRYIDGLVWELPCEPPALSLTGSSGLSRAQQLIAAQSIGIPLIPSYDGNSQGLVLDRVITKFGGQRWWTTFSGRVKAQRIYNQATTNDSPLDACRDLSSYALCARSRIQLGKRLLFNGMIESTDTSALYRRFIPPASSTNQPTRLHNAYSGDDHDAVAAHATLRATLPGHDLTASVGHNMDYVESSGDYAKVPLAVSIDLSSHDRPDGLQYRVGLHQVSASPTETPIDSKIIRPISAIRTVLHAQGAVAVEGEAYVWKGGKNGTFKGNEASPSTSTRTEMINNTPKYPETAQGYINKASEVDGEDDSQTDEDADGSTANPQRGGRINEALEAAAAADSGDPVGQDMILKDAVESIDSTNHTEAKMGPLHPNETLQQSSSSPSLEDFLRPIERMGEAIHLVIHPETALDAKTTSPDASPHSSAPTKQIPVTSETLSAAINDSLTLLKQLKETVRTVTRDVQDGSLQRLSEQLSGRQKQRRRPYSVFLAQPHVKINAAMGCLARMPLPPVGSLSLTPPGSFHNGSGSLPAGNPLANAHRRNQSASSLASRASLSSQLAEQWEPYLKGTALRVFASAGISGQVGRFTRPVLDYTAASLRLDVGLGSSHIVGSTPGPGMLASSALNDAARPDKHRAFVLEGRGSWHALSVSLAQQVLGPVRARADFRFALDPTNVPEDQGERSTLKGLAQTALSVRPSLLEAVYGADMVLPGTEGTARVAVWWSPKRKEAMAELRLF